MSDPFLSLPGTKRKRPSRTDTRPQRQDKSQSRPQKSSTQPKRRLRQTSPQPEDDDEIGPGGIDSDRDMDIDEQDQDDESDHDETPAERRLRLAKEYLDKVRLEVGNDFDAAEVDRDIIAQRLQEDVAESKGKVYKHIASSLTIRSIGKQIHHKNPVTCVTHYGNYFYTGCKNGIVEKWDITDILHPQRLAHINRLKTKKDFSGHTDDVLSIAISGEGKFLATGGSDKRICIWETSTMKHLKTFTQHRGAVMGLAYRLSTNQLYSTSADRTLKLWSINDLAYIETLFGHQDAIPAVASFTSERCISVGARDRSARLWKIVDETQLVFQTSGDSSAALKQKIRSSTAGEQITTESFPEGSTDCVAVIDEQHFVTGSDNGDIILWALNKKKPQFTKRFAHGVDEPLSPEQVSAESNPVETGIPAQPRWITCLASLPYTDLFFSGSWDGKVGMWKVSEDLRKFELVQYIETGVKGVVNSISVEEVGKRGADGVRVFLAIGSECRLGRWKTVKGGRNCATILTLGFS